MVLGLLITLLFSSCITQRKLEYLQDSNQHEKDFTNAEFQDYKLKPNDELYIQISSLDDAAANVFANPTAQMYGLTSPFGASLISHTIDKDGYLVLPVIGNVNVKDKTIGQVSNMIKEALNNVLNQPLISVKLVNRYITILGEVRIPGHYAYSQDKITIYDALGLAGDITEYGNRKQALLLRNENGISHRINIDLTKSNVLTSEFYYLRPNDILYIKPMRNRFWGLREFPFAIILSTITTGVLVLSYVK